MKSFTTLTAVAVPFDEANVDTNQLCPSRYNKRTRGPGYEIVLFHDRRFLPDGQENPDFILNRPAYRSAQIIVADRNFGCGSSRESAVYALAAYGFRAIVAPSFGDIFAGNCFKNGLLPLTLSTEVCDGLRGHLRERPGAEIAIDLAAQTLRTPVGNSHAFEVHPFRRHCLLNGLDDVDLTLKHTDAINAFVERYRHERNWLF